VDLGLGLAIGVKRHGERFAAECIELCAAPSRLMEECEVFGKTLRCEDRARIQVAEPLRLILNRSSTIVGELHKAATGPDLSGRKRNYVSSRNNLLDNEKDESAFLAD